MSHSQFHSTKLFILRPLTHRGLHPRGISATRGPPLAPALLARVSGRFLRSNSAFTEGLDYILSRPPSPTTHPPTFSLWTAPGNTVVQHYDGLGCGLANLAGFLPSSGHYAACCTRCFQAPRYQWALRPSPQFDDVATDQHKKKLIKINNIL